MFENKFQNLPDPILCNLSDCRGRSCVISSLHAKRRRLATSATASDRGDAGRAYSSARGEIRRPLLVEPRRKHLTREDREHSHTIVSGGELFTYLNLY